MLDNLRGMAVFASVVDCGSFSGAAKSLGITTSAVSQQVRALENDIGIILLHRSTRKISLTEAGESFYLSCQDVVNAARNGRYRLSALRDDLTGQLRISCSTDIATNFLIPAFSDWLSTHEDLTLHLETENKNTDLIDDRIDISVRICDKDATSKFNAFPLYGVTPILVATPEYLQQHQNLHVPADISTLDFIHIENSSSKKELILTHDKTGETYPLQYTSHIDTNSSIIAKQFALEGKGIVNLMDIDVAHEIITGQLMQVLPSWVQSKKQLYALAIKREQHPAKVLRSIDLLKNYFSHLEEKTEFKSAS